MMTNHNHDHDRYRQILTRILHSFDRRPREQEEPIPFSDINDVAAINQARYVSDYQAEIHHSVRDAAQRALARLKEGDYGICIDCDQLISPKRLAAVPWAERCVDCQAEFEEQYRFPKAA